jgi:phage shock protein A
MVVAMGIFDRMGQAISEQIEALLEKAEDPGSNLDRSLEAMREVIRAARREVVSSVAAEKQLRRSVEHLDAEIDLYGQRAESAVRHGDDGLAREALLYRRRLTNKRDRAEALRAQQRSLAIEMKERLARMEQRFRDVETRKGTLAALARQAGAGGGAEALGVRGGVNPFDEFRRIEGEVEAVELAFQAQREVEQALDGPSGREPRDIDARFAELGSDSEAVVGESSEHELAGELESLKRKVRVST